MRPVIVAEDSSLRAGQGFARKPEVVHARSGITAHSDEPMTAYSRLLFLLTLVLLSGCKVEVERDQELTARDSSAIEAVRSAYVRAWLADDTAGVLATLDSQAVLLPPGRLPVKGQRDIRAYWWPDDGSHTSITDFDWKFEELTGTPQLAFSRGISTVAWRYQKDTVRSEQTTRNTNLTILRRGSDGRWRILRQMWGPPLPG
jgi:ketosteroid isomerase-like protein